MIFQSNKFRIYLFQFHNIHNKNYPISGLEQSTTRSRAAKMPSRIIVDKNMAFIVEYSIRIYASVSNNFFQCTLNTIKRQKKNGKNK